MKKLKKYNSFEELKLVSIVIAETNPINTQKEQALEECFNFLRTKLVTKQKNEENSHLYGQQLNSQSTT
jgi:hypothetical protein